MVRHRGAAFPAIVDGDIADAAAALASTLETADRGIIYEHRAQSASAARLMAELKVEIAEWAKSARRPLDRDLAAALRRTERGAKSAAKALGETVGSAYLDVIQRLLAASAAEPATTEPEASAQPTGRLVLP